MKLIRKKYFRATALSWTVCFIPFLLAYLLVLAPQQRVKAQTEKQLAEIELVHNAARKAASRKAKIQLNQELEKLRKRFKDFVFDLEESANLTFDISQLSNNVQVASFSIRTVPGNTSSTTPDFDYVLEKRIVVDFTASFDRFATFLNALERRQPVVFVDKFTMTRPKGHDSRLEINMELVVLVGSKVIGPRRGPGLVKSISGF
jgi:hypothetical protein